MFPLRIFSIAAVVALAGLASASAQGVDKTVILRVERRVDTEATGRGDGSKPPRYLPKFVVESQSSGEVIEVEWRTPRDGLSAESLVRLDFCRDNSTDVETLETSYPAGIKGERVTTFRIPGLLTERGSSVTSWRVTIRSGGKILAEQKSSSWR